MEMSTIRGLITELAPARSVDKHLPWGAKASAYATEILDALAAGMRPVLVELENDLAFGDNAVIEVDHHGPRAGVDQPTSLHQVFALLGAPPARWTHWFELVAANDRGHVPAMLAVGATPEEMARVRAADRAAQGITAEQESEAAEAVRHARTVADGKLTLVELPHGRTAAVVDRLDSSLGGPGYVNLLVLSPGEVNFYGEGRLVLALARLFPPPQGWYGGGLPQNGYWGHRPAPPDITSTVNELVRQE